MGETGSGDQTQQPKMQPQAQTVFGKKIYWYKVIITVLVIIVVTAIIVGGYWFFISNKDPDTSDLTGPVPKPQLTAATPSATSSTQKDDTSHWKTYKNEGYGFSIRYPNSWDYIDQTKFETQNCAPGPSVGEGLALFGSKNLKCIGVAHMSLWDDKVEFVVYSTTEFNPLKAITEEKYTELTVDGEKAVKNFMTETSAGPRCTCTRIYINHNNEGFMIEFVNKDLKGNHNPIYDTILSTFKFLD